MPTLVLCTGFEHGINNVASLIKGNVGAKFADGETGDVAIVSSTPRTGGFCLEVAAAGITEGLGWTADSLGSLANVLVTGVGVYLPSALPTSDNRIFSIVTSSATIDMSVWFRNSDDKLILNTSTSSGTAAVGPTVVADTWYWIDLRLTTSGTAWTADWAVDTAAQTQFTHTAPTSDTISGVEIGSRSTTATMTVRYDDLVVSATSGDYPLGKHMVKLLTADTGGTTAEIGTANATSRFVSNATADATHNSAQILTALTEGPPPTLGGSASGVAQRTGGSTNAVGIPMTTYTLGTGESFSGLRVEIPGWAASATANRLGFRTYNGTTETILQAGTVDPNFDADTASPAWFCKMATGSEFDTQTEVDAFVMRIGYSDSDVNPVPGAHAIYGALAVKESSATNATVSATVVATTTALPAPTVQTGSTVSATTITTLAATPKVVVPAVPPAIATTTLLPAPTVQTGSTVSATAIATAAALPAPAVQTGSSFTAVAIATATALPAPTVTTTNNVEVAAIATAAALPAPTVQTGSVVSGTAIVTAAALPAPTVQTGSTVVASSIDTAAALPAPQVLAASTVDQNQAVPPIPWMFVFPQLASPLFWGDATVIAATNATVSATAVATTSDLPAPTVQTGSTVSAVTIASTAALPAPTVQTGATVSAATIATVTDLPAPSISAGGNITITAAVIATVTALPAPTVQTDSQVSATSIATVTALPAPAVVSEAVVAPAAIATVTALPAPTLQTGSQVTATTIATVTALPAPPVAAETVVSPSSIATVTALPAPTSQIGSTVSAGTVATVIAFPAPTVTGTFAGIKGRGHGSDSSSAGGSAYPPSGTGTGSVYPRSSGGIIGRAG